MGELFNVFKYKDNIINILLRNKKIIQLLNPVPSDCEELDLVDVLRGGIWEIDGTEYREQGCIFDHDFVRDVITEKKTFIFVEDTIPTIRNDCFIDFDLFICVFTHKDLVRLDGRSKPSVEDIKELGYDVGNSVNRIDLLCDLINSSVSKNKKMQGIGDISPAKSNFMTVYLPNKNYYGKCLKYRISNYYVGDGCV